MEQNKYNKCTIQIIDKSFARCLLCLKNVKGNVYDHVLGVQHQSNLSDSNKIELLESFHAVWSEVPITLRINEIFFFPHLVSKSECCICNKFIGYRELLVHIKGRNHQLKIPEFIQIPGQLKLTEEKLTENQLLCDICQVVVSKNRHQEHINGKNHQDNLKQLQPKSVEDKTDNNQVQCDICKVFIQRNLFQEHINGRNHQENLMQLNKKSVEETRDNKIQCDICKVFVSRSGFQEHVQGRNHQEKSIEETKNKIQCEVCKIPVARIGYQEHINGINHEANLKLLSVNPTDGQTENNQFECDICKVPVTPSRVGLQEHINGKNHLAIVFQLYLNNLIPLEKKAIENQAQCDVCKVVVSRDGFQEHINGKYHQTNLKLISLKYVENGTGRYNFQCNICKISFTGNLQEHMNGRNHQMNLKLLNPISVEKNIDNYQVQCDICKIVVTRSGLQEHINGSNHQTNWNELNPKPSEEEFRCDICEIMIIFGDKQAHVNGKSHQGKLIQLYLKSVEKKKVNNQVQCDICKIVVTRGGLEEHINGRNHQTNLNKLDEKLSEKIIDNTVQKKQNEMKQEIGTSSSQLNELTPFVYFTDSYVLQLSKTVPPRPLAMQKIASDYFRCLVCKTMFIKSSSLNLHVSSEAHQCNYNDEKTQLALKTYHETWQKHLKLGSQQIFFQPHNDHKIYCQLCLVAVKHSKVKIHCRDKRHLREVVDGQLWKKIDESLYHDESNQCFQKILSKASNQFQKEKVFDRTEQFYSGDLLQKLENKPHRMDKTIIMSSPGVYNCLLCHKKGIVGSFLEKHCASTSHQSLTKSRYQNHIVRQFHCDWSNLPADFQLHQIYFLPYYTNYSCLCCGKDDIMFGSILSHTYGKSHIQNFQTSQLNEIPKCFDLTDESIRMNLYPESITMLLKEITGNPNDYVSFQKLSLFEIKCLLCKTKVDCVASHFGSKNHKQLIRNSNKVNALKKYHKEWKKIPKKIQIHQLNYEPYDEDRIMCTKCKNFFHYENLYDHLTNDHKFIDKKTCIPVKSSQSEHETTNSPKTSIPDYKFAPFTYYPVQLLQKMRKLEGKIYRNVQMISESNYRCLLCKMFVDNLDEHISTSDHLKLLSDRELISHVEKFHNLWATIENYLQFQQRYFFPVGETMVSCVLCLEDIKYSKLVSHLQVAQHSCLNGLEQSNSLISFSSSSPNLNSSTTTLNSLNLSLGDGKTNETDSIHSSFNDDEDSSDSDSSEDFSDESTEELEKQLNNLNIESSNDTDAKKNLKLRKFWKSLPERLNINRIVIYWKNGIFSCQICHVNLEPNKKDIISHIVRTTHVVVLKTTGIYQRIWDRLFYECLHCNKKIQRSENDWQAHLNSAKHVALSKQKNFENFEEIFCKICRTVLYGDKNILRDHTHAGKKAKNKEIKVPSYIQMLFKTSDNINLFVQKIYEEAMDVMNNNKDEQVCEALMNAMKPFCKNINKCQAYRFGSRVTGLCTIDSDLDVFLDLNSVYDGDNDQESDVQANYVTYTHLILRKSPKIWTDFEPIRQARTPILKVFHQPTKIDCDVSFRNGLSVENTKLLCFFFDFQPIIRKVILFLKTWSVQYEFDQRINNYALSLMVIFYLQTKGFMYSVSQLRNMYKGPPKMITGWDCTFFNDLKSITPLPCDLTYIEILRDFFEYYTSFNYMDQVICPLLGRTIQKSDFHLSEDCDGLPEEMKCYKDYIQSNSDPELFRSLSPLCVQDPFDLSHNITKAVPPHMVIKFSKACQVSNKSLNDILNDPS